MSNGGRRAPTRARARRRMLILLDAAGRIAATAPGTDTYDGETNATLRPLPGQTLHEVALPPELEQYVTKSPGEIHRALSEYVVRPGPSRSTLFRRTAAPDQGARPRRR